MTAPIGYAQVKDMAKARGVNIPDLLVLARINDPFFVGGPADREKGEWFAATWEALAFSARCHIRRVHYLLLSHPELHPSHMAYENTEKCWAYLNLAAKYARHLDLVDPLAIEDHRNPDEHLAAGIEHTDDASFDFSEPRYQLPTIKSSLSFEFSLPEPEIVDGFDYSHRDQPIHLELWVEKSTMNNELLPVCEEYGVNFVPGAGFQSITRAVEMLRRVQARLQGQGKPARVFWVSDFDPAGLAMPVATARHIEHRIRVESPDGVEVKLQPIALTQEQVVEYELPRIWVKDSDRRKTNFENQHGPGQVELDALEALHPGTLAQLASHAIEPYVDLSLARRMAGARRQAEEFARAQWVEATQFEREELERLRQAADEVATRYEEPLSQLAVGLHEELRAIRDRHEVVSHAIETKAEEFRPTLPPRPAASIDPPDEREWLFDSNRSYLSQLAVYHAHQRPVDGNGVSA